MGWLFMSSLDGYAGPREYLDAQFTFDRPDRKVRVLRSALVGMKTYSAALQLSRPNQPNQVCAMICLVRYNPRDRRGEIFGYKDIDETMGPYEARYPAAILDLLTPTDNAQALDWRERCRAALVSRSAKPKLKNGMTVVFENPIAFRDGRSFDRLTVVVDPRQPRAIRFRAHDSAALYTISGMRDRVSHRAGKLRGGREQGGPEPKGRRPPRLRAGAFHVRPVCHLSATGVAEPLLPPRAP